MVIIVVYSIIIFIACTLGALVGIGGGIIIKPLLDFIGYHSVEVVGFISTCAMLAMSTSSLTEHIITKTEVNKKTAGLVSLGGAIGGVIGNKIFYSALERFNSGTVKGVQAVIIIAFIIFVIIYVNQKNIKSLKITNSFAIIATGLVLGLVSAFLGIGGGPINTAFLVLLFSFNVKESAVYSVAIIFCSRLTQLITIFIDNRFEPYKEYLPVIIACVIVAVAGVLIGSRLNKKLSNKFITTVFSVVLGLVGIINIYNAVVGFSG